MLDLSTVSSPASFDEIVPWAGLLRRLYSEYSRRAYAENLTERPGNFQCRFSPSGNIVAYSGRAYSDFGRQLLLCHTFFFKGCFKKFSYRGFFYRKMNFFIPAERPEPHQRLDVVIVRIDDGVIYLASCRMVPGGVQQESRAGVAAAVVSVE